MALREFASGNGRIVTVSARWSRRGDTDMGEGATRRGRTARTSRKAYTKGRRKYPQDFFSYLEELFDCEA